MTATRDPRILRIMPALLAVCLLNCPVQGTYSGGSGTTDEPYQIATAADLIALGASPEDYDRHFVLTADIDLDPTLSGGTVFSKAVIAPDTNDTKQCFQGTAFTGVFDGNHRTISHLMIAGEGYLGLFGQLGPGARVENLKLVEVAIAGSEDCVGGLAGYNWGNVVWCCSSGTARGRTSVGGLVGINQGDVMQSYSSGAGTGECGIGGLLGINWGNVIWCHGTGAAEGQTNVGGLAGHNGGLMMHCYSTGPTKGTGSVGGLVGDNYGEVHRSYSSSRVTGSSNGVGGLVGTNAGIVGDCYALGTVAGGNGTEGGLGGSNWGRITTSYSTGVVSGAGDIGGLLGWNVGEVTCCFWDIQSSGQAQSVAGTGLTTPQMQTAATFLAAGWDFMGEAANGVDDIWQIAEGPGSPKLVRQVAAFSPDPQDGDVDVIEPVTLRWAPGASVQYHDVYFADDRQVVADATTEDPNVYRGRQPTGMTTYEPGTLEYGKTYYWRIDEVNQASPNSPWKGKVWSFTAADFIVVDDFESYDDDENPVWNTWIDGYGIPENGSMVGCLWPMGPCIDIAHTGRQSMQFYYENTGSARYSEAVRTWVTPQNWTVCGMGTLTLHVHGWADSQPDRLYVVLEDSNARIAVAVHPDPNTVRIEEWTEWNIPFNEFTGVDPTAVAKMSIGVGDRSRPIPFGEGLIHVDDIRIARTPAPPELDVVLDDFESYNDDEEGNRIFETWIATYDLPINGAMVGHMVPPYTERTIVHSGLQSMPFYYANTEGVVNSRAYRGLYPAQDWTTNDAVALVLWFRGVADNDVDVFYIAVNNITVFNPNPNAVQVDTWTPWIVPLASLAAAGVNIERVTNLRIGVGDKTAPSRDARGILYIDDIGLVKETP